MKASRKVSQLKPSAIRKMLELSANMKDIIHMEQGEPDFATPRHIVDAAVEAMRKGCTHYTDASGTPELREAIAEKLGRENKIGADPKSEITVTAGSQEAMLISALGFLQQGEEALVIDPYYPAYYEDTLLAEAVTVLLTLKPDNNYRIDPEALEKKITPRTKMIWICNPSNPTGHVFSRSDLEVIAEAAIKHDLLVFADEIYEKIVYDGKKMLSIASLPRMEDRTITVQGFSKAYAMTGWRIGYMVAEKRLSSTLRTLHYYATLCPNIISQAAGLAALTGPQRCVEEMLFKYKRRRALILEELDKIQSVSYNSPEGAFYAFPDFSQSEKSDEKLAIEILEKARVVTVPGSGFGIAGQGHLRISYSCDCEKIREGMTRIRSFLETRKQT